MGINCHQHQNIMATSEGGGDRPLAEKLPDNFEVKSPRGTTWRLSGALELHRLAVENKLKGREAEITEEIINATCTLDDGSYKEATPLYLACSLGSWESALLLLSRGADPNRPAINSIGYLYSPLYEAAHRGCGSLEIAQELLKNGARQDIGKSPLELAKE